MSAREDDLLIEIKKLFTEQGEVFDKQQKEVKAYGEASAETKEKLATIEAAMKKTADEIHATAVENAEKLKAADSRLLAIEQKIARNPNAPGGDESKTIGQQLVDSDDFQAMVKAHKGRASITLKSLQHEMKTTITTTAAGTAGPRADRLPGIITPQLRPFVVRDLMPGGTTTSNAIEYVKENVFTNAAAPQVEAAAKAESALTFILATAPVRTIAHWIPASRQILDDWQQLRAYIDGRLLYGLELVEEQQLLAGDGTGQNILGLIPQATAYNTGYHTTGDTKLDTIRHAIKQARIAEFPVDGIILNPEDWEAIELIKTSIGEYVFGDPASAQPFTLWGKRVVETNAITAGTFLVGAFRLGAMVWDREQATVEVSTEHQDFFVKNMVAIRAEERLALTVYRPAAFVSGSL